MGHRVAAGCVVLGDLGVLPLDLGVVEAHLLDRTVIAVGGTADLHAADKAGLEGVGEIGDLGINLAADLKLNLLEVHSVRAVEVQLGAGLVHVLGEVEVLMLALPGGTARTAAPEIRAKLGYAVAKGKELDPALVALVIAFAWNAVDF